MTLPSVTEKKPRRHKGSMLLSPRDRWAFRWMAEQYTLSLDHLQILLGRRAGHGAKRPDWISESAMRQVLARWHKLGYVEQKHIFSDYSAWIWPTRRALTELGISYATYTPHFATLPHLHAINHVRLFLEQLHPQDIWISERYLKSQRPRYEAGSEPPHTPDALWQSHSTQEVTAIEVELSVKKAADLRHILYDLSQSYSSIWYFALPEAYKVLAGMLAEVDADTQERIYLYELEKVNAYTPISL